MVYLYYNHCALILILYRHNGDAQRGIRGLVAAGEDAAFIRLDPAAPALRHYYPHHRQRQHSPRWQAFTFTFK